MTDGVALETLSGAVEEIDGQGEDVQLWRARLGEVDAIGATRAAALRELANELDRRSLELSIGRDVAEASRRTQGVSR